MGRYANARNILSQHARFLLEKDEAQKIVTAMHAQVTSTWYNTVRSCNVSEKDAETIRGAFVYAVLMYRQQNFHGEMPLKTISRIEFGEYKKGKPFPMTVTLRNGQKLEVQSERRDFVTLKGKTDFGTVTIKHPDPTSAPVKLSTKKPNRKKDLSIHYLEIPAF